MYLYMYTYTYTYACMWMYYVFAYTSMYALDLSRSRCVRYLVAKFKLFAIGNIREPVKNATNRTSIFS